MNIWEKNVLPREISHLNATSVDQSIEFSEKKNRSLVVNSIFYPLDSFVFGRCWFGGGWWLLWRWR